MDKVDTNSVQNANQLPQLNALSKEYIEVKIKESPKNWADHAKFSEDLLGPVIAAIFGLWLLRITKRLEQSQWRNQKLIEKRIDVWDKVGSDVNDIYCYCMRVGAWKQFTPPEIIKKKRDADKIIHLNRPYFSDDFFKSYLQFMSVCFEMYQGHGEDAKLKTSLWEHKNARNPWDSKWDSMFHKQPIDEHFFYECHENLLHKVSADFDSKQNPSFYRSFLKTFSKVKHWLEKERGF